MTSEKAPATGDTSPNQTTFTVTLSEREDGRWRVVCDEHDAENGAQERRVMDDNFGSHESARAAAERLSVFMRYESIEST